MGECRPGCERHTRYIVRSKNISITEILEIFTIWSINQSQENIFLEMGNTLLNMRTIWS